MEAKVTLSASYSYTGKSLNRFVWNLIWTFFFLKNEPQALPDIHEGGAAGESYDNKNKWILWENR